MDVLLFGFEEVNCVGGIVYYYDFGFYEVIV